MCKKHSRYCFMNGMCFAVDAVTLNPGGLHCDSPIEEESLLLRNWSCSSHPFPRTRDLRQLQVWERPVALEAELALTLKVLGTVANSTLGDILDQPLCTLSYIYSKLQACVPAQPTASPRLHGHLFH
ncbi:interferon lambda-1-like [Hipposideros larvatus]